jgi:hypothetical protein
MLKKLYGRYIFGNKKFLSLKDAIDIINRVADLRFIESTIGYCYASSLMIIIDPVKD